MNKIEKLIQKLCPNGVEFRALGELGEFISGLRGKTKNDFKNGNARYVSYLNVFNNLAVDLNANDFVKILPNEKQNALQKGDILFTNSSETQNEIGMSSVITNEPLENIYLNSFCFGFRFNDKNLIAPEFSKFLFRDEKIRRQIVKTANGVTRFNVSKKKFENIKIPIPPLEIQREIVKILDTFTELEKELEKRRLQYEYYREKLLSFDELVRRSGGGHFVKMMKLCEVFDIKNGYTPSKAKKEYWENGTLPWFRMDDIRINGRILSDSLQHITPDAVKSSGLFPANSIIIATTATIGEHALITVDSLANQQFSFLSKKKTVKENINMKFMFYYGFILGKWCKENVNVSGFASVNMPRFKNFQIPVPPLKVQNEVVEILDKFDSLVNDLSSGIPAEIKGRKAQYEYYRERLLTFKAKAG